MFPLACSYRFKRTDLDLVVTLQSDVKSVRFRFRDLLVQECRSLFRRRS